MSIENAQSQEIKLLQHHEQMPLCTTRLPYRQGRKLTAVKVYTINNESNHLLVFGVPSLNLRLETKALFAKFGKLLHFILSKNHPAEDFTETYHARYEKIQSARIAKRMIDTKNFYGGSLHVCYAPEFETLEETRSKLLQRKKDVQLRLKNLKKETTEIVNRNDENRIGNDIHTHYENETDVNQGQLIVNEIGPSLQDNFNISSRDTGKKMNMGEENVIYFNKTKRKISNRNSVVIEKKFKPCFTDTKEINIPKNVELIDCTSVEKDVVSNINEALNYNKFGNEIIRKVEAKPENKIIFNINKSLYKYVLVLLTKAGLYKEDHK